MLHRFSLVSAIILGLHGLIPVMGFAAYWPLAKVPELAYKTTLLGGHWEIGAQGMQIDALLWLIVGIGFIVAGIALGAGWKRWRLTLVVTALDWESAYGGIVFNVIILTVLLLRPQFSKRAAR